MSERFFLSSNGVQVGPFPRETILKKIGDNEYKWTDYVYDEAKSDWVLLLDHPYFSSKLAANPSAFSKSLQAASTPSQQFRPLKEKEWYLLKEGNNHGPFSPLEIIRMLQEKKIFEYDFLYHTKLNSWRTLAEIADFSPENIRKHKESGDAEVAEVFFRRRHVRAHYRTSLILHNNKKVFKGHALELSVGGAGIEMKGDNLESGQTVFLHFQPGAEVPPFNATCEVVSKQLPRDSSHAKGWVRYGIKFVSLNQTVREVIKNFTTKAA
jgi:hypothetical protein